MSWLLLLLFCCAAYKRHPATQQMTDQQLIGELFAKHDAQAAGKSHNEK
jgi:hypothetical protein